MKRLGSFVTHDCRCVHELRRVGMPTMDRCINALNLGGWCPPYAFARPPIPIIRRARAFARNHRAPSGRSGVHSTPNAGHSCGRLWPCNTAPARHTAGSSAGIPATPKREAASNRAYWLAQAQPLAGISPMPRHLRATGSKTSSIWAWAAGLPSGRTQRVYWISHLGAARFELFDAHRHALKDVQRLETGHDDRHAVFLAIGSYSAVPITVQTWPGGQEPLHDAFGRIEHGADRRRNQDVGNQGRKVGQPQPAAWAIAMATAGAVVSKPMAKKTTSRSGCRRASPTASIGE